MIAPTQDDIGRRVVYRSVGGETIERGALTATTTRAETVFVRYAGDDHAKLTLCRDLEWEVGDG